MDIPEHLRIPEDFIERLQKPSGFRDAIEHGKSLQDIIGYSDELMQKLYQSALEVFHSKFYRESADGFLFLTTLNPYVYAYWMGLGMSQQHLEEYEQAILAYECATSADPDAPQPHFYLAACHFFMNEKGEGRLHLVAAKQKCVGEHASFIDKVLQAEERFL